MATRDDRISLDAEILWQLLRAYEPRERVFALAQIAQVVQRRLKSRESSRYSIDFTRDEAPTRPDTPSPDIGDRATRKVNVDEIAAEIARSKKPDRNDDS